jgi:hypothetical protein
MKFFAPFVFFVDKKLRDGFRLEHFHFA